MVLRKGVALLAMLATAKGQMTLSSEKYGNNGCPGQMSANGNVCEQAGLSTSGDVNYDGTGIRYRTAAQVVLRSQIDESPPGSIADIPNEAVISADEGNRYIKLSVSMNEASWNEASNPNACDISLGGDLSDKVALIGSTAIEDGACSFHLANNKYLGSLDVTVRFDADNQKRAKLFLQYAPHANDPSIKDAKAGGFTSSGLAVVEQNENLHSLVWNDGGSSASGNDLVLPVEGLFVDKRYKVKNDAGIQLLDNKLQDGGSDATFSLLTEGLTLKTEILDYIGNGGTSVVPTLASQQVTLSKEDAKANYVGTASNTGVALDGDDVQPQGAGGAIAADYAQYKLDDNTELAIEGLPTFRKEYLDTDCEVCDIRITLKGLDNGVGGFLVNTAIAIDESKLAEDTSTFPTNQLKLVAIAASKDVASGSAHALSEIFSIAESSVTKTSTSLLSDKVDLISLITLDGAAESCNAGDDLSEVPLYKFKSNLLQPYLDGCEITAPNSGVFGASQDIVYNNQDDAAATVALRETDSRDVKVNGFSLILNGETDLTEKQEIAPVGDTLKLIISKSGITGAANFDVTEIKRGNVEKVDFPGTPATFATNPTDDVGKDLLIKSTVRCTGSLELKLTFVGGSGFYDVKLPCSRISSASASDSLELYYAYETALNLATDSLEVNSYYAPVLPEFQVATSSFGKCDNSNNIDRSEIYDPDACPASGDFTDVPADSKLSYTTTGDGLDTLIKCSTKKGDGTKGVSTISSNGVENYVIDYELAMKYERQVDDYAVSAAFTQTTTFCDSQEFVMTIRRDAEAYVETVQLAPSDNLRAVLVADIGWSDDGSAGCDAGQRRLRVLVQSKDKHNNQWVDSDLTEALLDIASGHQNPNSMQVHEDSGHTTISTLAANALDSTPAQGLGTHVILKGQCIAIASCPLDELGLAEADAGVNGDSWSDYSGSFRTDIILRGHQLGTSGAISFDTRALITLSYQECPIEEGNQASGEAALALQLSVAGCTGIGETAKSRAQYTAEETFDCTDAGEDDSALVKGYTFVVPDGTAATDYTFAMYQEAQSQGWSIESSVISFSQYTAEDVLVGTYPACTCAANAACVETAVTLPGGNGDFAPDCSNVHELSFPLMKFKYHPTDFFYVEYSVVLKSSLTEEPERRHLRSAKFALKNSAEAHGETNGFRVHSTIAESNAEAPAPDAPESSETRAAPAAPVSEAAETSGPNKDAIDQAWWFGLAALIVIGLGILLRLIYCAFPGSANQGNDRGSGVLSAQPGAYGYKAVRQSRYSNLRY